MYAHAALADKEYQAAYQLHVSLMVDHAGEVSGGGDCDRVHVCQQWDYLYCMPPVPPMCTAYPQCSLCVLYAPQCSLCVLYAPQCSLCVLYAPPPQCSLCVLYAPSTPYVYCMPPAGEPVDGGSEKDNLHSTTAEELIRVVFIMASIYEV